MDALVAMSDWSDSYTTIEACVGQLRWLLPDAKWSSAREKATLLEQSARALIECIKRHEAKLKEAADRHATNPILRPTMYAYLGHQIDAVGVDGGKATVPTVKLKG